VLSKFIATEMWKKVSKSIEIPLIYIIKKHLKQKIINHIFV